MVILPAVNSSNPASNLNRVLFPQPEGPTNTKNSPSRTVKLIWRKTISRSSLEKVLGRLATGIGEGDKLPEAVAETVFLPALIGG